MPANCGLSLPVHITSQDEIQLGTRLQYVAIFLFFFQCEFFISDSCWLANSDPDYFSTECFFMSELNVFETAQKVCGAKEIYKEVL